MKTIWARGRERLTSAIDAYKAFDTRRPGWMKVKLKPHVAQAKAS